MSENQQQSHNEEVHEIMGQMPRWLIRWGLTVIFLIFAGILFGTFFISSPETISGPIVLAINHPPAHIKARCDGEIRTVFYSNHSRIDSGSVIARLSDRAEYEAVKRLEGHLAASISLHAAQLARQPWIDSLFCLGPALRSDYTTFRSVCHELTEALRVASSERSTLQESLIVFQWRDKLITGVERWKEANLIVAPLSGRLHWLGHSRIESGELLGAIFPDSDSSLLRLRGTMIIPQYTIPKLRSGQQVSVRVGSSPTTSVMLTGVVDNYIPLSDRDDCLVSIDFPEGIPSSLTDYLQHSVQISAQAEIIVRPLRMFDRFISFRK